MLRCKPRNSRFLVAAYRSVNGIDVTKSCFQRYMHTHEVFDVGRYPLTSQGNESFFAGSTKADRILCPTASMWQGGKHVMERKNSPRNR